MPAETPYAAAIRSALAEGAKVVTLKNVKVLRAGTWGASTGVTTVTEEDLEAMVSAADDPEIDLAVLKLGHVDPINQSVLKDGAPALGHFTNLRVEEHELKDGTMGTYLVADIEDVPVPFAQVMAHAYKRRSAEIAWGVKTPGGANYRAALTGVALLGKFAPAAKGLGDIETVEDLYKLYGVEAPTVTEEVATFSAERVSALAQGEGVDQVSTLEAPAINIDRIRDAWRAENPYDPDKPENERWIREVWLTPGGPGGWLILEASGSADLDSDELLRVTWAVNDEGEVSFGTEEKVKVTYTPAELKARRSILEQASAKKIDAATTQTLLAAIPVPADGAPGAVSAGNPRPLPDGPQNDTTSATDAPPEEAQNMDEKRIGELLKEEDEAKAIEEFKKLRATGGEGEGDQAGSGQPGDPAQGTDPDKPGADDKDPAKPAEGKVLEGAGALSEGVTVKDGVVMLTEGVWKEVQTGLNAGKSAASQLREQEIDKELRSALSAGKIATADEEKAAWRGRLEKDFEGTKALLGALQPRFSTTEIGDDDAGETNLSEDEDKAMDAFMESTFPELAAINQGGN